MAQSTQAVLPSSPSPTTKQHELSTENLTTTQNTKLAEKDDMSTDDELDTEIGIATLQPMRRAPVQRVRIICRNTMAQRHSAPRVEGRAPATAARVQRVKIIRRNTVAQRTPSTARVEGTAATPPPIPERFLRRAKALQTLLGRDSKRDGAVLSTPPPLPPLPPRALKTRVPTLPPSPVTQQSTMEKLMASVRAAYRSSSVYSSDNDDMPWDAMQVMYAEHQAGRLVFPPSPLLGPVSELRACEEAQWESETLDKQKELFEIVPETGEFRSPFEAFAISGGDMDELLGIFPEAPVSKKREKVSLESVLRAVYDESILGSETTEDILRNKDLVRARSAPTSMPEGRVQQFEFIAADAWLLDEERDEEQDQIANQYGEDFTFSGKGWTVLEGERSLSLSSIYSTPSPFSRNRSMEPMLYSPVRNPFYSDENPDSIEEAQELSESQVGFAGLDIEALVADAQDTGHELQNTDKGKGEPEILKLAPHSPRRKCGCFHCEEYSRPVRPSDVAHDPSQWCYCLDCRIFREEVANTAFWKAHFAKLDADLAEAKAEEKRRKADLLKFEAEDASKPKKACRLGDWVRRYMACPSADE